MFEDSEDKSGTDRHRQICRQAQTETDREKTESMVKVKKEKKQKAIKTNKKINRNVAKLEKQIEKQEEVISELITQSMQEEVYSNFEVAEENKKQIEVAENKLNELMEQYELEIMKEV